MIAAPLLDRLSPRMPRSKLKAAAAAWLSETPAASLTDLDAVFRAGAAEGRWAAVELALLRRRAWESDPKRWGGLFLRWARCPDAGGALSDAVGSELLGPLWLAGHVELRQMTALAAWPELWPWRAGIAALAPSLALGERDWALFEVFARACLPEGSRFYGKVEAYKGLRPPLRAALAGCPALAKAFLERRQDELPAPLMSVAAKAGFFGEPLE